MSKLHLFHLYLGAVVGSCQLFLFVLQLEGQQQWVQCSRNLERCLVCWNNPTIKYMNISQVIIDNGMFIYCYFSWRRSCSGSKAAWSLSGINEERGVHWINAGESSWAPQKQSYSTGNSFFYIFHLLTSLQKSSAVSKAFVPLLVDNILRFIPDTKVLVKIFKLLSNLVDSNEEAKTKVKNLFLLILC